MVRRRQISLRAGWLVQPTGAWTAGGAGGRRAGWRRGARRPGGIVLDSIEVVELGPGIAGRAAGVGPASLRALDAIHLATAPELGSEIGDFGTYDPRLPAPGPR